MLGNDDRAIPLAFMSSGRHSARCKLGRVLKNEFCRGGFGVPLDG